MPEYFGIEPKLAIVYNSGQELRYTGSSFGLLGAGARLSGLSVVDRARPRRGAPRLVPSDTYLLNGQGLVKCADVTATSPGCSESNGNYAGRVENYKRIRLNTDNWWIITDRDGTEYRHRPVRFFLPEKRACRR